MHLKRTEWHLIGHRLQRTPFLEPYGVCAAISVHCMHVRNVVPHIQRSIVFFSLIEITYRWMQRRTQTNEEVIHGASTDVHCRWDDTRPCYTTRWTGSDGKVILFRLSQLEVFTLSLDVSLCLLTTIIAGGAKEFTTFDSTLKGYIGG